MCASALRADALSSQPVASRTSRQVSYDARGPLTLAYRRKRIVATLGGTSFPFVLCHDMLVKTHCCGIHPCGSTVGRHESVNSGVRYARRLARPHDHPEVHDAFHVRDVQLRLVCTYASRRTTGIVMDLRDVASHSTYVLFGFDCRPEAEVPRDGCLLPSRTQALHQGESQVLRVGTLVCCGTTTFHGIDESMTKELTAVAPSTMKIKLVSPDVEVVDPPV